jgi:outer membrane biosynthesis protein TonB
MNEKMFEQLIKKPKATKKWLLFPVSLLLHGFLIASIVVVPYLDASNDMPEVQYIGVKLVGSPPPPPPPAVGKKGSKRKQKAVEESETKKAKPKVVPGQRLVPPREIPEDIIEEDDFLTDEYGDGGPGVEGVPELDDTNSITPFISGDYDPNNKGAAPISVTMPRLIRRVAPIYPLVAKRAHIQGSVEIQAVTDIYGKVVKTTVLSGHPLLRGAAVQAVKQWIYEPYVICGIPKPVTFSVMVRFILENK